MPQITWLDVVLLLLTIASGIIQTSGYIHRRKADAELVEVRQTANDAQEKAKQTGDLTGSINKLAEAIADGNRQSATERDGWRKDIRDTTEVSQQVAVAVGQVKEGVRNAHEDLKTLSTDVKEGRTKAVEEVKERMDENTQTVEQRLDTLEQTLKAIDGKLDQLLLAQQAPRAAEPAPAPAPLVPAPEASG